MSVFNKFRETIFLKEDSDLESRIEALNSIRDKMKNQNEEIDKDIKLLEYGLNGEKSIIFELKNMNIGMYVLHDVNLKYENLNAQIDFAVFTPAHCYLIECKNMIGDITINRQGEFRRVYYYNNQFKKEAIYSPYAQAIRHKEIIKKIWLSKNSSLSSYLFEKQFDAYYRPLVVLANSKGMLKSQYAPHDIKKVNF